jgi:hypothetical protein
MPCWHVSIQKQQGITVLLYAPFTILTARDQFALTPLPEVYKTIYKTK